MNISKLKDAMRRRASLVAVSLIGFVAIFGVVRAFEGSYFVHNVENFYYGGEASGSEELGAAVDTGKPIGIKYNFREGLYVNDQEVFDEDGNATLNGSLVSVTTTVEKLTTGGRVLSSSTVATAGVLTLNDFASYGTWELTPNTADLTLTLPTSSTLATYLPNAGDRDRIMIRNATSTAGIDVILAAGTGIDLGSASTTISIPAGSIAPLECVRHSVVPGESRAISCVLMPSNS